MNYVVEKDFLYSAAGRVWVLPELHLDTMPDGTLAINQVESDEIHRSIANEICSTGDALTFDEFEFLCDITVRSFSEVAEYLQIHKTTISKWRNQGAVSKAHYSAILKKWFWFEIFGDRIQTSLVPLSCLRSDDDILGLVTTAARNEGIARPVAKKVA